MFVAIQGSVLLFYLLNAPECIVELYKNIESVEKHKAQLTASRTS